MFFGTYISDILIKVHKLHKLQFSNVSSSATIVSNFTGCCAKFMQVLVLIQSLSPLPLHPSTYYHWHKVTNMAWITTTTAHMKDTQHSGYECAGSSSWYCILALTSTSWVKSAFCALVSGKKMRLEESTPEDVVRSKGSSTHNNTKL